MEILAVSSWRLLLAERHVTNTTRDLHYLFRFGCSRRASPFHTFLLQKGKETLNIKLRTAYQIYFGLHGCFPGALWAGGCPRLCVFFCCGVRLDFARSISFRRLSKSCNFWSTLTRFLRSYSTISCLFFKSSMSAPEKRRPVFQSCKTATTIPTPSVMPTLHATP